MEIIKIGYHHSHDDFFQIHREHGSGDYLLLLVFTPSRMVLKGKAVVMTMPFFTGREHPSSMGRTRANIWTIGFIWPFPGATC